ncbi:MAG: AAA family ATPase, partial [Prochlorococcaceae cyanobacterium ETNP2_MAG_10]|nr:AAA family ATPase [Prochlorococcaceae cyanobacterium ETNP2_MAG_10]
SPLSAEVLEELTHACSGLSEVRVRQVAARALAQRGKLGRTDLIEVLEEKRQAVARSEVLEYCVTEASLADIGGLDSLKCWLEQRHQAFSDEARHFGLPLPRGVLLIGPQGTGKSLTAKAIAHSWSMPLLRLDVGRLFAGLVGASEARTRETIQRAEAMAPCVLWIDEIDKGFGGDARSDGGTSQRVLANVLTWMAEKTSAVFVVATANGVERLPGELLRKGRFDEIFLLDLPISEERHNILELHIQRRRPNLKLPLTAVIDRSEDFSGA